MKIKIATRGSELAVAQSNWVAQRVKQAGHEAELIIIKTRGDLLLDKPLHEIGGKGLFTKEVDRAVLDKTADVSVHSFKDMPVEDEPGLMLGAVPERESCEDVLVVNDSAIKNIGCGSLRRQAQIKNSQEKYNFESVRGNIHTRLQKMKDNGWGGLVVAEAALNRLNLSKNYQYKILGILPAAGQGALGLRVRDNDSQIREVIGDLNCSNTEICVRAEATFLRRLGGGCHLPAGIRSVINGEKITLKGGVFALSNSEHVTKEITGDLSAAERLGADLAQNILDNGGKEILDSHVL